MWVEEWWFWVMRRVDGYNTFGPRFVLKIRDLRISDFLKSFARNRRFLSLES